MARSEQGERADTIVVGTDGSRTAPYAPCARRRGWRGRRGPKLLIVTAFSDLHPYREHIESSAREDLVNLGDVADQLLMRATAEADGDDVEIETASREGDPAEVLSAIATEENARLVMVGDRGLERRRPIPARQRFAEALASCAVQRVHRARQGAAAVGLTLGSAPRVRRRDARVGCATGTTPASASGELQPQPHSGGCSSAPVGSACPTARAPTDRARRG